MVSIRCTNFPDHNMLDGLFKSRSIPKHKKMCVPFPSFFVLELFDNFSATSTYFEMGISVHTHMGYYPMFNIELPNSWTI